MTAVHRLFTFVRGDTWRIDAVCNDVTGKPVDLATAAALVWSMSDADANEIASASLDDGIAIVDAANGRVQIEIDGSAIASGVYQDVLKLTMRDGQISTQAVGLIEVTDPPKLIAVPISPPDLVGDLAKLKEARRSGVLQVRFADREVRYRDDRELERQIAALESELAGGNTIRNINIRSKGWS